MTVFTVGDFEAGFVFHKINFQIKGWLSPAYKS